MNFQATYRRGKFLGKGGFAKCYEFVKNGKLVYAGKIVPKTLLVKQHQKVKMANEIKLHRSLKHENIVQFIHSFEGKIIKDSTLDGGHFAWIIIEMITIGKT